MKKHGAVACTFLTLIMTIFVASSVLAAERMQAGQWELTITEGGHSHTTTECETEEKMKAANGTPEEVRTAIEQRAAAMNCAIKNFKMEGDTVSYTTACTTFSMDNKISYHGDRMETETTMKGSGGASRVVKARRLGACP